MSDKPLAKMNRDELVNRAHELGLEPADDATKAQLRALITEEEARGAGEADPDDDPDDDELEGDGDVGAELEGVDEEPEPAPRPKGRRVPKQVEGAYVAKGQLHYTTTSGDVKTASRYREDGETLNVLRDIHHEDLDLFIKRGDVEPYMA